MDEVTEPEYSGYQEKATPTCRRGRLAFYDGKYTTRILRTSLENFVRAKTNCA